MTTWALIMNGLVSEITDSDPADRFNPGLTWVDCTTTLGVTENWIYNGTTFSEPAQPSPADQAAVILATKLASGIVITSTSTPGLNATYALDAVSTAQVFQIGLFASQFGVFPSGGTTLVYPDQASIPHTFTLPQFVAFLRALAPLVSQIETQAGIMAQGGTPAFPAQIATIP